MNWWKKVFQKVKNAKNIQNYNVFGGGKKIQMFLSRKENNKITMKNNWHYQLQAIPFHNLSGGGRYQVAGSILTSLPQWISYIYIVTCSSHWAQLQFMIYYNSIISIWCHQTFYINASEFAVGDIKVGILILQARH